MTWALRGAIAVSGLLAGIGLLPSSNASATERLAAGNTAHPIPGIVEPYCKDEGQLSLNRCAANWLSLTTEMHYIVQAEMFLRLPVEQEIQMALAGDAWVEFKEAHCALVAEEVEGGSLYPMVLNRCLARVTNERIAALRGWGTAPVDRAATETRLQTAYLALADPSNGEGPRLEMAQVHWETYRTQHCQLEGALQTEPEAEADCLARLAAERTAQLQEIMGRRG
ncbi:MAG: lysozyme inhibitor LprI family protein [Cyanobacteria bacterium J06632_22]